MKEIQIKNLNFSYDSAKPVLSNVNIDIEEGEYVAIIGHNGSGKSTLAKLIVGLENYSEGEILINGTKLDSKSATELRKKIGLVFQNPDNQFVGTTVEDDIAFGLENRQIPREKMSDIIYKYASLVGMEKYLNKEASLLSGGQKQRVALASTLALEPDILILDEAVAMLDSKGKNEINSFILRIKQNNSKLTIISITHDIEEAFKADRVILMNKGTPAKEGKPSEILNNFDLLDEYHLKAPFMLQLKKAFKEKGINLENCSTLEEAAKCLSK